MTWENEHHGSLRVSEDELNLTHTLKPGQSFRWKEDSLGRWTGVVRGRVVRIWRVGEEVRYQIFPGGADDAFIRDYFRLDVDLGALCAGFVRTDERIAPAVERFRGLRVLRQEPEEALLSYICSAANSVVRISAGVEALSRCYGEKITSLDGVDYFSFPAASVLAGAEACDIGKVCNLGFRCANLNSVARILVDRPGWLQSLRHADYKEAQRELVAIKNVGLKIADCALLMSLDKDEAFPVDTHVRKIAVRYYMPEFDGKTLTSGVYHRIGDFFRDLFGPFAGWAQEYIFYSDLLSEEKL